MPDVIGFPVYGTEFLLGAFGVVDRPRRFLLELYFPYEQTFETEKVAFDKVDRARRKAAFVSPNVEGKVMRAQGYKTADFLPAYVKPKHVVDMSRPLKRRPGERLLGAMAPMERYNRAVLDNLQLEDDAITRTEEWMAAQILLNGSVTVASEDFPAMTLDFLRPAGHTIVLTGGARWNQAGVSPLANLRAWARTVMLASGYNPTQVVMDPLAYDLFVADAAVTTILNNRANTPTNGQFPQAWLNLVGFSAAGAIGEEVKYGGQIGEFDIWVYSQTYVDDAGAVQKLMPDNSVILGSPAGFQGTRCYGAIRDKKAGLRAMPRFPKMWDEEDPSVTYTMTQSAPLPVAGWAEASLAATVA